MIELFIKKEPLLYEILIGIFSSEDFSETIEDLKEIQTDSINKSLDIDISNLIWFFEQLQITKTKNKLLENVRPCIFINDTDHFCNKITSKKGNKTSKNIYEAWHCMLQSISEAINILYSNGYNDSHSNVSLLKNILFYLSYVDLFDE